MTQRIDPQPGDLVRVRSLRLIDELDPERWQRCYDFIACCDKLIRCGTMCLVDKHNGSDCLIIYGDLQRAWIAAEYLSVVSSADC